jgi:ferric-dicitrate binding protein FerR (iron transport regulator)
MSKYDINSNLHININTGIEFTRVALELGYPIQSIIKELREPTEYNIKLENLRIADKNVSGYALLTDIEDIEKAVASRGTAESRYTADKLIRILSKYTDY